MDLSEFARMGGKGRQAALTPEQRKALAAKGGGGAAKKYWVNYRAEKKL